MLPFGAGARTCIGRQLALIEAAEALAVLVRSFDFELEGPAPQEMMNFVMIPTPYRLRVKAASPL
jgi:cytochrome P450